MPPRSIHARSIRVAPSSSIVVGAVNTGPSAKRGENGRSATGSGMGGWGGGGGGETDARAQPRTDLQSCQ